MFCEVCEGWSVDGFGSKLDDGLVCYCLCTDMLSFRGNIYWTNMCPDWISQGGERSRCHSRRMLESVHIVVGIENFLPSCSFHARR